MEYIKACFICCGKCEMQHIGRVIEQPSFPNLQGSETFFYNATLQCPL
jgi:hypothetical protein